MSSYLYNRRNRLKLHRGVWLALAAVALAFYAYWLSRSAPDIISNLQSGIVPQVSSRPGDLVTEDAVQSFTPTETAGLIRENYGAATPSVTTGITKVTFRYRSELPN